MTRADPLISASIRLRSSLLFHSLWVWHSLPLPRSSINLQIWDHRVHFSQCKRLQARSKLGWREAWVKWLHCRVICPTTLTGEMLSAPTVAAPFWRIEHSKTRMVVITHQVSNSGPRITIWKGTNRGHCWVEIALDHVQSVPTHHFNIG